MALGPGARESPDMVFCKFAFCFCKYIHTYIYVCVFIAGANTNLAKGLCAHRAALMDDHHLYHFWGYSPALDLRHTAQGLEKQPVDDQQQLGDGVDEVCAVVEIEFKQASIRTRI